MIKWLVQIPCGHAVSGLAATLDAVPKMGDPVYCSPCRGEWHPVLGVVSTVPERDARGRE